MSYTPKKEVIIPFKKYDLSHHIPSKGKMGYYKHMKVVEYWVSRIDESDIAPYWEDAASSCWGCGYNRSKPQLAHIIPRTLTQKKSDSQKESPSNLVLLCDKCHKESPDVNDPEAMFKWIRANNKGEVYDLYRLHKILEEFDKMYGESLDSYISRFNLIDTPEVNLMKEMLSQTNTHGTTVSNSTIAWVVKKSIDKQPKYCNEVEFNYKRY